MHLPPSAFLIIGFLIWGIRAWKSEQAESSEFQARPTNNSEVAR
jgi:Na+-transporting NADH:ubiquinone oxidoreductase subunit D